MTEELRLKLCDIQGRLFELSAKNKYPSAPFIKAFMNSKTAKYLDSPYNRMQWAGEEYLLDEIISANPDILSANGEIFSVDIMYWIGYIYRYWSFYTGESSAKIFRKAPTSAMKRNYMMFHTMDPSLAIDDLKEIYNQRHNKQSKNAADRK